MKEALRKAGFEFWDSNATFYVWVKVKGKSSSSEFAKWLLEEHHILVTPGVGFGQGGEGWFRISLTAPDDVIEVSAQRFESLSL